MYETPILYSFRRCPYAMRARLVLFACQITCELREVVLRDKPKEMLTISPKATVPVLQLSDDTIIDESRDIITWAIEQNDPNDWQQYINEMNDLIDINDQQFKTHLDKYKYSSHHPDLSKEEHRENGDFFLKLLNQRLKQQKFLSSDKQTVTDLGIFPFIRQFAFVDKEYFDQLEYTYLQNWLEWHLKSPLFGNIMQKYDKWLPNSEKLFFA
ncbi:MAG: glutathione S-transferase [Kordiimonadaceae bacterium]|jgi:glutathione S-transferase|nr:glutathione S-transferase [Kordiimonadaceae bacterium]MBT6032763.1 glutathione S-transferase [Kordiimonadaceae bacterium]